jgi:hypothetical protein
MLTGRYPVEARTLDELRERHGRGDRVPLRTRRPDLSAALVRAIERATEPDPARRLTSAAAFEAMLGDARGRPAARGGFVWVAGSALALVALAALVPLLRHRSPAEPADSAARARLAPAPGRAAQAPQAPAGAGPAVGASGASAASPSGAIAPPTSPLRAEAPLAAHARWFRVRGDSATPLEDGGRVAPGDRLYLDYHGDGTAHVYVLDEDDSGKIFALFPLAGSDLANPLHGGETLRLPGRSGAKHMTWQVTSPGGRETFLVLASRLPLAALERVLASAEPARPGHAVEVPDLAPMLPTDLRGVGLVSTRALPVTPELRARLREVFEHTVRADRSGSVWGELLQVDNPAP